MSRRPKLSLSSDENSQKKQAPGFDAATSPPDQAASTPQDPKPPPDNAGTPNAVGGTGDSAQKTATWPTGRQIVKVALVVVLAALSLYLLKRRLP